MENSKWNNLTEPIVTASKKKVYAILKIKMGQLLLCNDGKGFYGFLHSHIKDNVQFSGKPYNIEMEKAKKYILKDFYVHINGIGELIKEQSSELSKL